MQKSVRQRERQESGRDAGVEGGRGTKSGAHRVGSRAGAEVMFASHETGYHKYITM